MSVAPKKPVPPKADPRIVESIEEFVKERTEGVTKAKLFEAYSYEPEKQVKNALKFVATAFLVLLVSLCIYTFVITDVLKKLNIKSALSINWIFFGSNGFKSFKYMNPLASNCESVT